MTGTKTIKEPTEDQLHKAVAAALRYQRPKCIWWHTPNSGKVPVQYRKKLIALGLRPGVADLVFIGCKNVPVGFIELKRKSGRIELSQKEFRNECEGLGIPYEVVKTSDTNEMIAKVLGIVRAWGGI